MELTVCNKAYTVLRQRKLWYVDFACNGYDPKWKFANWGSKYWSRTTEFTEHLGL